MRKKWNNKYLKEEKKQYNLLILQLMQYHSISIIDILTHQYYRWFLKRLSFHIIHFHPHLFHRLNHWGFCFFVLLFYFSSHSTYSTFYTVILHYFRLKCRIINFMQKMPFLFDTRSDEVQSFQEKLHSEEVLNGYCLFNHWYCEKFSEWSSI